nr:immunoglobulin heavy chain junction region [Macaca mulatta]
CARVRGVQLIYFDWW